MVQVVSMDRDKVNHLAGILQQALEVLRSIDEPHVSTTSSNNNSTTSTRTSTDSAAPSRDSRGRSTTTSSPAVSSGNSITEALSRARRNIHLFRSEVDVSVGTTSAEAKFHRKSKYYKAIYGNRRKHKLCLDFCY